ncbi:hypothetical protein [Spirosoma panaciterrae]|nr:hypothetical protein [Spirosoma panaciterrae]
MNSLIDLETNKETLIETDTWFTVLLIVSAIAASVGCIFTQMI